MADFPKKQQQCLIPKYLLEYLGEVNELHPDPSDLGGGDNIEAGTGIVITGDETKTISVDDETVAMVANLSTVAFSGSYSNLSDKPDLSVYELKEDAFTGDYRDLTNKPDLSVYELKSEAFSGNYNDLTNKPDLSIYAESADLAAVAITGSYNDLLNKPTIPTATSDLTNDSGFITGVSWNEITGKPTFAQVATTGDYDDLTDKPDLSVYELKSEAFSGDYDDLTNKPTIPTATSQLTNDSGFITNAALNGYVEYETVSGMPLIEAGNYYGPGYEPGLTNYNMLTSTRNTFKLPIDKSGTIALLSDIPSIPQNIPSLSGDNTWTGYNSFGQTGTNTLYTNVLTVPDADSTSPQLKVRDYNSQSLTEYSITIPKATGTLALTSDIPSTANFVTTDTSQQITGEKTFVGEKRIKFKQSSSNTKLGFTCYDNSNREKGYLEYNPSDNGLYLGRYGSYGVDELGFLSQGTNSYKYKLLIPNITVTSNRTDYIPVSVNGTKADSTGDISIAIPTVPTNVSAFTNDAGYITSSDLPTNHVTTNTDQTITGVKTFSGTGNLIKIKNTGNAGNGIMFQDNSNNNIGYFEFRTDDKVLKFGVNTIYGPGYKVGLQSYGSKAYTAYLPDNADKYTAIGAGDVYLPLSVNGNTASVGGNITLSATSTSTVTPTTTQLVFTYTDNTTETVTLMTGASVSTTTTLS